MSCCLKTKPSTEPTHQTVSWTTGKFLPVWADVKSPVRLQSHKWKFGFMEEDIRCHGTQSKRNTLGLSKEAAWPWKAGLNGVEMFEEMITVRCFPCLYLSHCNVKKGERGALFPHSLYTEFPIDDFVYKIRQDWYRTRPRLSSRKPSEVFCSGSTLQGTDPMELRQAILNQPATGDKWGRSGPS